jgi:hypothetical protein
MSLGGVFFSWLLLGPNHMRKWLWGSAAQPPSAGGGVSASKTRKLAERAAAAQLKTIKEREKLLEKGAPVKALQPTNSPPR